MMRHANCVHALANLIAVLHTCTTAMTAPEALLIAANSRVRPTASFATAATTRLRSK